MDGVTRIHIFEADSYDWITFLPMSDGGGAYNRYFGRLNTGKTKIRGVMARRGDTPEHINKMQQEVFEVLAGARSLEDLRKIEPKAREVYRKYLDELDGADVRDLAIHRMVSRLDYSPARRGSGSASSLSRIQETKRVAKKEEKATQREPRSLQNRSSA